MFLKCFISINIIKYAGVILKIVLRNNNNNIIKIIINNNNKFEDTAKQIEMERWYNISKGNRFTEVIL